MTCAFCRVEDKLSVCIKTTPSSIQKKKLKLCCCVWTRMTWPRISESTFPSKIPSYNSWKTAQLSKTLCSNVPLTVQRPEDKPLSPEFLAAVSSLNLLEASSLFRDYLIIILFFFYNFKTIEYIIIRLFNSKAASRVPLIIFFILKTDK